MTEIASVQLTAWSAEDLPLLHLINAPEMTEHLGGPETDEQVRHRHRRYLAQGAPGHGQMYVIRLGDEGVGSIGYWERIWAGNTVYEIGWSVLPAFQGRGIAATAAQSTVDIARAQSRHRYLHAFPSVDNQPSNAICRRLGFTHLGPTDFEYPPGQPLRCNDWRLDLTASTYRGRS
jgi:RimJ/RimL family protein N-acetyltransferase